jgi:hypothetical protein
MTRHSILADALKRQLAAHGYHLTDSELRDVAANAIMALDAHEPEQPRTELDREAMWRPADAAEIEGYEHGVVLGVGL